MRYSLSLFILFILLFSSESLVAQCPADSLNMTVLYNYDDNSQPTASGNAYNDLWGYVDTAGLEYGILGAADSILIFNVSNKDSVYLVDALPGLGVCIWRDMKIYDQYLYAGTECNEGILIFDLSTLPLSFSQVGSITADFVKSHNIYIDTSAARLYAVGSESGSGVREGFTIYDLAPSPTNPTASPTNPLLLKKLRLDTLPGEVAAASYYSHDIFVKDNIAYCSHGSTGYGIWDVNDVENIFKLDLLALPITGSPTYVHSSWNDKTDNYAYVASEVLGNTQIYVIDQTDPTDIMLDTIWKEPLLSCIGATNNVPHNPYSVDDILYISYYQDGVQLLDITDPDVPVRVGYYDIDTTNTAYNGTTGNWGVYPFLPSGLVLASDVSKGFFVMEFAPPVVPLEITSFEIETTRKSSEALLTWTIESAVNVQEFIVERSIDGKKFEQIDHVAYYEDVTSYEFLDKFLSTGTYFYRLKIKDFDGSFKYSEIRNIRLQDEVALVLYPTVTSNELFVELSKSGLWNYEVYNVSGQLVIHSDFEGNQETISVDLLPSGIYYLQLSNKGHQVAKSFQKID